ncbi:hypothetical protein D9O29_04035 [Pantoea vagans]|uniref:Uncharacterized protein n=1 Tax=Pantoea vagans TaxID=470934 RepID=A0ABY3LLB6_9GAMM|nr:hypothetical protein D9O29_04035 [Pantoea vagans]
MIYGGQANNLFYRLTFKLFGTTLTAHGRPISNHLKLPGGFCYIRGDSHKIYFCLIAFRLYSREA